MTKVLIGSLSENGEEKIFDLETLREDYDTLKVEREHNGEVYVYGFK